MDIASSTLPTSRTFITQLLDSLSSSSVRDPLIDQTAVVGNANTNPLNNVPDATRKHLLSLQVLFPSEFVPALDLLDRRLVTRFRIRNDDQLAVLKTVEGEGGREGAKKDIQMQDTEDAVPVRLQDRHKQTEEEDINNTARKPIHPHTDTPNDPAFPDQDDGNETIHQTTAAVATTTTTTTTTLPTNTIYYVRSAQQHHRPSRFATSYDTTTSYQVRLQSWNCSCPAFAFSAFPAVHAPQPIAYQSALHQDVGTANADADAKWAFGGITLGDDMPPVCKHVLACVLVERCKDLFGGFVEEKGVSVEEAAGWAAGWGD